jgi:YVTN family beta-propeller protein
MSTNDTGGCLDRLGRVYWKIAGYLFQRFGGSMRATHLEMWRIVLIVQLVFIGPQFARGQSTPSPALLVLAKRDRSLAIVDPKTLKVVARVPSGPDPHEVIASPDGKLAYISNYGGGAYNTISVADLVGQKSHPAIDLGAMRGPHGLWFAGGKLYFTAEANKVFGRYDPSTGKVDWIMGTGQDRTHMIVVTKDLDRIFTSNVSSATLSIFDKVARPSGPPGPPPEGPAGFQGPPPGGMNGPPPGRRGPDWGQTVIPVGRGSEGFDVTPDGKELWVGNAQDGTISIVDLASKMVAATLAANVRGANRLKFTLDGKRAFVSSLGGADLAVFDVSTRKEVQRVRLGHGAAGILMQPGNSRAYVACSPDNYVAVIDLTTLAVIGRIEAGQEPDGLAWAAR